MVSEAIRRKTGTNRRQSMAMQTDESGKLPLKLKVVYALARYTIRASYVIIGAFANLFYLSLGADLQWMAFYIAIGRSLDVLTDPFMGWLSDRTRTKWGRRKPFFVPGLIMYNSLYIMFWSPPESLSTSAINHWFGLTYMFFFFADTFTSVPYYALGAELTDSYEERNSVYFWSNFLGQLGTFIGILLPTGIIMMTDNTRLAYLVMAIMFAVVHAGGLTGIMVLIKERPLPSNIGVPFVVIFRRVMLNLAFQPLLISWILDWSAVGLLSAILPLWVQYVLIKPTGENPEEYKKASLYLGYCACATFLSAMLAMPLWLWLGKKIGKRYGWLAYNVANSVTCPWFFLLGEGDITGAILIAALNGAAFGGQFFVDSVTADVMDYDEFLNGDRVEGAFSTITTFVPKIVLVATTALPLAIVAAAGFVKNLEWPCEGEAFIAACPKAPQPQNDAVVNVITFLFCAGPVILSLVACYIKLFYPIKSAKVMDAIQDGIVLHKEGKAAVDPLTGRTVKPVPLNLSVKEQKDRWLLDTFSMSDVASYQKTRSVQTLKTPVVVMLGLGILLFIGGLITTAMTFSWLDNEAWAWVPILGCVLCGGVFTEVVYYSMKFSAVGKLHNAQLFDGGATSAGYEVFDSPNALVEQYLTRIGPKPKGRYGIGLCRMIWCWCCLPKDMEEEEDNGSSGPEAQGSSKQDGTATEKDHASSLAERPPTAYGEAEEALAVR